MSPKKSVAKTPKKIADMEKKKSPVTESIVEAIDLAEADNAAESLGPKQTDATARTKCRVRPSSQPNEGPRNCLKHV